MYQEEGVHLLIQRESAAEIEKKGTKKDRNVHRNLMELGKQPDCQFAKLETQEQAGAFQFRCLLPGVKIETGCHGYLGFLQLMGGSSEAVVSWGLSRTKDEMEACGCGGAIPGSRGSKGQFPTRLTQKFHFKSHSSGNLCVRPRLPSSPISPFPILWL